MEHETRFELASGRGFQPLHSLLARRSQLPLTLANRAPNCASDGFFDEILDTWSGRGRQRQATNGKERQLGLRPLSRYKTALATSSADTIPRLRRVRQSRLRPNPNDATISNDHERRPSRRSDRLSAATSPLECRHLPRDRRVRRRLAATALRFHGFSP